MAYGIIYRIANKLNGKVYVGQTKQKLRRRINQHKVAKSAIGNAIRKYGLENFMIETLEECDTLEELNEREIFWIAELNCKAPNGYNQDSGGKGSPARPCSDETRDKKSAAVTGEKNPFFGKHHTTKSKMLISKALTGNKSWLGRHHTDEENFKASASKRGKSPYKNLLAEMDNHKLSYTKLSKILGLNRQTVSDKMSGKLRFTDKDIAKLVELFGKPVEYLMERDANFVLVSSANTGKHTAKEHCVKISMTKRHGSPFKNLLAEMDKRQLTYTALAEFLGLSRATISSKMLGKENFTAKYIAKLVELFGKPSEYLMERDANFVVVLPVKKCRHNTREQRVKISMARRHESPFKNLLAEMDERRLTYTTLGAFLGLSCVTISGKMRGKRNFTAKDTAKLVELFGKPAEYLLARAD